jgi:hypothetical protein
MQTVGTTAGRRATRAAIRAATTTATIAVAELLLFGCGKSAPPPKADGEPYAIGATLGASCTIDGKPTVVKIDPKLQVATLVGAGQITKTCGDKKSIHDVVQATTLAIEGPVVVKAGVANQRFTAKVFAGTVELGIVDAQPTWFQGPDCANVAAFAPLAGAHRELVVIAPGTCTLHAELFGARGSLAVKVE